MPLIYRVMTRDGDKPKVGPTARTLGVRVPPSPHPDIVPNNDGTVGPLMGGMSVAPEMRFLSAYRVPARYRALVPRARGNNKQDACWRMGAGPFQAALVASGLQLRPDSRAHGVVEPASVMDVNDYQALLAATRDEWQLVEP